MQIFISFYYSAHWNIFICFYYFMKLISDKKALTNFLYSIDRDKRKKTGFVPTMGALHEGHLSLVRRARSENDIVVCSIFVNPTQFNNKEDLAKYPRTLQADCELLGKVHCDIVFAPSTDEMYPESDSSVSDEFDFGQLEKVMEGVYRPGHFRGVAMIVNRLFNCVEANRAYFGEKDYQQLQIIRKLAQITNSQTEIIGCPIVREPDGLAMSSRNILLTLKERRIAPFIYQTLTRVKKISRNLSVQDAKQVVYDKFGMRKEFKLEYFEISDAETLQPLMEWKSGPMTPESPNIGLLRRIRAIGCIAVFLGKVRLIDNVFL